MEILVAPDKFKGSLTASEVARAITRGIARALPAAATTSAQVADGGEGTAAALHEALGGTWITADFTDPLGRPVQARYALAEIGGTPTAIMEMSATSGFERVLDVPPNPWSASTFGTGEMMRHAAAAGAKHILIGIGGSATNDGGSAMAHALGFRFLDESGAEIQNLPADLLDAVKIIPPDQPLPSVSVACDVTNPLLGSHGSTRIYGPQKGIPASGFTRHENRLAHLADLVTRDLGCDHRDIPGAGAAGGLGFGLLSFCHAQLHPGFNLVADAIGLRQKIATADLIITGEGFIDAQSLSGKAPAGVARLAREAGKPVVAVCGGADIDQMGNIFDLVLPIRPKGMPLDEAINNAANLLEAVVAQSAPLLKKLASP